jgi:hypothetical protein
VQVDFDGASALYGPISSACDIEKNSILISPNPASDAFKLEIQSSEVIDQAIIQILDMMGSVVWEQTKYIQQGSNNLIMLANNLRSGTYIIRVVNEQNQFETVRLIVK